MTPAEFETLSIALNGGRQHGWKTAIADRLRLGYSTIKRYASGELPIPGPVEAAVRCLAGTKGRDDD